MIRAGIAEAVGTFFLIFTGTATAAAATLGKSTGGTPPDSLAIALASDWSSPPWSGRWARCPGRT